jgi:thiol:disulfide interchange protein
MKKINNMKYVKSIFAALLFTVVLSIGAFAQSAPKVIAVVNQADWCSVCKANGQRALGAFMENNKDGEISLVVNDVTDAETKKKSAFELKKLGITKAMKDYEATGVIYFFDAKTKKPITQITVANSDKEIAYVIGKVKKAVR